MEAGSVVRRPAVLVATATVLVGLVHLATTRGVPGPAIAFDEAGYLGNARWLARVGPVHEMPLSPSYAFGYPVVLAPAFRLLDSPDALWTAIHVVNSALLATLVPLLYVGLRRIAGVGARAALLAAVVGATTPAVVGTAGWATAENLNLPLVAAVVLALHALLADERRCARLWFGPLVVALLATHPRNVLVVGVAAVVLVALLVRGAVPRGLAAANLAALSVGVVGVRAVQAAVVRARWDAVHRIEGGPGDVVEMATSASGLADLLRSSLGQAWYLAVGTLGAAVLGIGALAVVAVRPRRRGSDDTTVAADGRTPGPALDAAAAERWTSVATLAMAAAVFVTSVAFFARNHLRDDHLVYGRHNDSFVPLWVAVAVAVLASAPARRAAWRWWGAVAGVTTTLGVAAIALLDPEAKGGVFVSRAVPALGRVIDGPGSEVLVRGLLFGLGGIALAGGLALATGRPVAAVAVLVAWSAWVGWGLADGVQDRTGRIYDGWELPAQVDRIGVDAASIDVTGRGSSAVTIYPFALPDVHLLPYWPGRDEVPPTAWAFDSLDDAALRAEGARLVLVDEGGVFEDQDPGALGLWVRPGPQLDRLAAQGWLLPEDPTTDLPGTARRGELDAPRRVDVDAGDEVDIPVRVTHTGSDAPWPDAASLGRDGAVVLRATIVAPDGAEVGRATADLGAWTWPGDTTAAVLSLAAVDGDRRPLPAGDHTVEVALAQRGAGWTVPLGEVALHVEG